MSDDDDDAREFMRLWDPPVGDRYGLAHLPSEVKILDIVQPERTPKVSYLEVEIEDPNRIPWDIVKALRTIRILKGTLPFTRLRVEMRRDHAMALGRGALEFALEARVKSRDTGEPIPLVQVEGYATDSFRHPQDVHRVVRNMLRNMLLHELDESFLVGGERPYDPHKGEIR